MKQRDLPYHQASPREQSRRVDFCLRAAGWTPSEREDPFAYAECTLGTFNQPRWEREQVAPTDGVAPFQRLFNDPRFSLERGGS